MSEAKAIIDKMPDNCPVCLHPVKPAPTLFNKKRVICTNTKCGAYSDSEELIKSAQCPNCYTWIRLKEEKLGYECPQCKHKLTLTAEGFREDAVNVNESDEITSEKVITKSKLNIFSDHTAIHPGAGIEMLLVRGNNIRVLPPDEKFPLRVDDKPVEMDAELYYVCSVLPKTISGGTEEPIHIFDQHGVPYDLQAAASLTLRITDPAQFFKWVGYRECTIDDLVTGDGSRERKILDQKLQTCFPEALTQAVQAAQKNTGKDMETLSRVDVGNLLRESLTSGLFEIGLSCDNVVLASFVAVPGKDLLLDRVERKIQFDTEPITVHEKDNPDYSAAIIMHGEGRIRIRDRIRLRQSAMGQIWAKKETLDEKAANTLSEEAARTVHAAYNDILQPMIDDTGVRLSSIERFLTYMQDNIETYLNKSEAFESLGLEVIGLSMKMPKGGYMPNAALEARDGNTVRIASVREEENLRKFMDSVRLEQAQDESGMRIKIKGIEADEAQRTYEFGKRIHDTEEQKKDTEKNDRIREIGRGNEIDEAEYQTVKKADERRQKDEDERHEHQKREELADYDHAYEVWLRQRRMQDANIDADRKNEIGDKEHDLRLIGMDEEAARGSLLADEKTKEAVHDIMLRIQESDLELHKKLDAYAYLQKLTEQKDQAELWENNERARADIRQLLNKIDLENMQGQAALLEQKENNRAEREQKKLQAEFARDMELKRLFLSYQIEKMNHESEKLKQAAELRAREEERAERLKMLEANFQHIETLEEENTDRTGIQAELDKVRAICDYLKTDSMARAAEAANVQERLQKEAAEGETKLTKVAGQVEELQKQLGEMLKVNGEEYKKGLEEVRNMIGFEARDQKFEDMFKDMRHAIELIRDRAGQVEKLNDGAKITPIVQNIYQNPANSKDKKD